MKNPAMLYLLPSTEKYPNGHAKVKENNRIFINVSKKNIFNFSSYHDFEISGRCFKERSPKTPQKMLLLRYYVGHNLTAMI